MRTVTKKIVEAWKLGHHKKIDNTRTDGQHIWLHGNCIAKRDNGSVYIRTAGYNTLTTRERLNGILVSLNSSTRTSVFQSKNNLYYMVQGQRVEWDGEWLMVA